MHARFRSLVVPGFFGGAYTGDVLPFAPEFSANLGYQHSWSLGSDARITARAETHYETDSWATFSEHPGTHQDAHTVSNFFLTHDAPDRRWSARVCNGL